jgi:hypothetical protein
MITEDIKSIAGRIFTKNNVVYLILALTMLNNLEHVAWVHHNIARGSFHNALLDKSHSIIVVLIIELGIVYLVHKGEHVFAGVFTFLLFLLQLIYYPLYEFVKTGQWENFIASIIFSLLFTISIYYFSIIAAKRKQNASMLEQFRAKNKELYDKVHHYIQQLKALKTVVDQSKAKMEQKDSELQQLRKDLLEKAKKLQELEKYQQQMKLACTCEKCGKVFDSEASKRSHAGRCKGAAIENAA